MWGWSLTEFVDDGDPEYGPSFSQDERLDAKAHRICAESSW
jgi:hypothetical protein